MVFMPTVIVSSPLLAVLQHITKLRRHFNKTCVHCVAINLHVKCLIFPLIIDSVSQYEYVNYDLMLLMLRI